MNGCWRAVDLTLASTCLPCLQKRGHSCYQSHKMSIRDANIVIIEVSRTTVKAGLGLHELLKTPAIVRIHSPVVRNSR